MYNFENISYSCTQEFFKRNVIPKFKLHTSVISCHVRVRETRTVPSSSRK